VKLEMENSDSVLLEIIENEDVQQFFTAYLNRPFDKTTFEIKMKEINKKALEICSYRCIRTYSYLTTRIAKNPFYDDSIKSNISDLFILDIGCCVGSDMRKLILDGASPDKMLGVDLESRFFEVGFEIFEDKEKLPNNLFIQGDFTEETNFIEKIISAMKERKEDIQNYKFEENFDLIQLGAVLHLLTEEKVSKLLRLIFNNLLKKNNGCLIGQTIGIVSNPSGFTQTGDLRYLHSSESLQKLMEDIGYSNIEIFETNRHWPLFKNTIDNENKLFYFHAYKL